MLESELSTSLINVFTYALVCSEDELKSSIDLVFLASVYAKSVCTTHFSFLHLVTSLDVPFTQCFNTSIGVPVTPCFTISLSPTDPQEGNAS